MGKTGVPGATESHSLGQGSDPHSPLLGHEPAWGLLKVEGSPAEDLSHAWCGNNEVLLLLRS